MWFLESWGNLGSKYVNKYCFVDFFHRTKKWSTKSNFCWSKKSFFFSDIFSTKNIFDFFRSDFFPMKTFRRKNICSHISIPNFPKIPKMTLRTACEHFRNTKTLPEDKYLKKPLFWHKTNIWCGHLISNSEMLSKTLLDATGTRPAPPRPSGVRPRDPTPAV